MVSLVYYYIRLVYTILGKCQPPVENCPSVAKLQGLSAESSCISTFPAEILHGFPAGKAFVEGCGPGRTQNFRHTLAVKIAQGDVAFMVQTAGDYGAVAEDTQLIPQAIAEYLTAPIFRG